MESLNTVQASSFMWNSVQKIRNQGVPSDFILFLLVLTSEETVIIHAKFTMPFSEVQDIW